MLEAWGDFVRQLDLDILTGYNINNFDFPSTIRETMIQSKQMGRRENKQVNFEGRVPFNLMFVLIEPQRGYYSDPISTHRS